MLKRNYQLTAKGVLFGIGASIARMMGVRKQLHIFIQLVFIRVSTDPMALGVIVIADLGIMNFHGAGKRVLAAGLAKMLRIGPIFQIHQTRALKMRNPSKEDILSVFDSLIDNCEGAVMAAKGGDYLHNFAFLLQEKLRVLQHDFTYYGNDEGNFTDD
jgi:hypothetical protein